VLPWTFFSQTLIEGMDSLVGNWGLITKVPVPVQIFPYVGALTNLVTLFLSLPIIMGIAFFSGVSIGFSIVLLPVLLLALFMISYSLSTIAAISYVYFRDLKHLMSIILQLWFYSTPVIYSESMVPEQYRFILYLNPVASIFVGIHQILVEGIWPDAAYLTTTAFWVAATIGASLYVQKYLCRDVIERI
jgi:ABC-type polysaccharide/polyol phosphate export permease